MYRSFLQPRCYADVYADPVFVNLLSSPGIDYPTWRNRFLGSLNFCNYGLSTVESRGEVGWSGNSPLTPPAQNKQVFVIGVYICTPQTGAIRTVICIPGKYATLQNPVGSGCNFIFVAATAYTSPPVPICPREKKDRHEHCL